VGLHAPSEGWFIASLIIAVIALVDALSPIPYITAYGIWVALLAYIVLVVGNLAQTYWMSPARRHSAFDYKSKEKCTDREGLKGRTTWLLTFRRTSDV
jgi:hypothetical protein